MNELYLYVQFKVFYFWLIRAAVLHVISNAQVDDCSKCLFLCCLLFFHFLNDKNNHDNNFDKNKTSFLCQGEALDGIKSSRRHWGDSVV